MNIHETFYFDKSGEFIRFPLFRRFFLTILILLVAILSFGVGRLTNVSKEGVSINYDPSLLESSKETQFNSSVNPSGTASVINNNEAVGRGVTASSKGTKYYYPHCGNNITAKNKVVFESAAVAENAGYSLARNCTRP